MDNLGIGKLITGEAHRDAIHVAVAPVFAGERLYPGQHVAIRDGEAFPAENRIGISRENRIGIVDPFLADPVFPKQKFWLFLYPGSITSLRHHWEHPAFVAEVAELETTPASRTVCGAAEWLHSYAESLGLNYLDLMDGARDWIEDGDYLVRGGLLEGTYISDEFWIHYEFVTGKTVAAKDRQNFFSCSC